MKKRTLEMIVAATLAVFVICETSANAQKANKTDKNAVKTETVYKSWTLDESLKSQQPVFNDSVDANAAKNYLTNYFFARWTDEKNANNLKEYRAELDRLIQGASGSGKEKALNGAAGNLKRIYESPNLYPACRYHAISAFGALESEKGVLWAKTLPYLASAYRPQSGDTNKDAAERNKRLADPAYEAIRLGALLGIVRHVQMGIKDEKVRDNQVAPLLIDLAADTPHKDQKENDDTENSITVTIDTSAVGTNEPQRTVEQHDWFRLRAIQALGYLKASQEQQKIIETLLTLMKNKKERPDIRYEAAFSLSQLDIVGAGVSLDKATDALVTLGINVCDDGIQFMIREMTSQQVVGSTGVGMGGMDAGYGGGSLGLGSDGATTSQTQADQINNSISQIKYGFSGILACVVGQDYKKGGLTTLDAVKNTPSLEEVLVNMSKAVGECIEFLEKGDPEAAKRRTAALATGIDGMTSSTSMTATVTVKNQPKVTMNEINTRLASLRKDLEILQKTIANSAASSETGATTAKTTP
ncbi:MAG: hypothetical protein LBT05_14650 [Planctomycetaceae bacterium]|jgi:hypothetical protein|nr:hypothetical protein [Planctomycetaceae bacterium]